MTVLREPFGPSEFAAAFASQPQDIEKLASYAALLQQWQPIKNLVAPATLGELWLRHFADSAQLLQFTTGPTHWVDLGSGAGFPGIVIALLSINDSKHRITLVESNARKCSFLRAAIRELGLGGCATVINALIETVVLQPERPGVERIVTARALASLEQLCRWSVSQWTPGTRALFLKGVSVSQELAAAQDVFVFDHFLHGSRTQPGAAIVELRGLDWK